MKIELEIPDRYKDRHFYLFAGMEPVMRCFQNNRYWEVKTSDCSHCGRCCEMIRENHPLGTKNGCKYLDREHGPEQLCGLGIFRPFGCAIAEMLEDCSVKWERVD